MVKDAVVNGQHQRLLARWAFKLCRSGGFRLPGFTLADDGYLILHDGEVFWGSDWMPNNRVIAPLNCLRGMVVRYPIRMKQVLLPFDTFTPVKTGHQCTAELRQIALNIHPDS